MTQPSTPTVQLGALPKKVARSLRDRLFGEPGHTGQTNQVVREAWLERTLAAIPAGSRILDAGAGELQYKRFCQHLNYVSQDFAQYSGEGDGRGLQTGHWDQSRLDIVSDITRIPEPDGAFDAVMCIEVLEHVPYPVDALRELARLLRPGGALIITAPFCALTHFSPYFYQTGFSQYFYEYWLKELGFHPIQIHWNGNYFEYLAQELRRLPSISLQYAAEQPRWLEQQAIRAILGLLHRLSQKNRGSEQLLAYGLHILAHKMPSSESASQPSPSTSANPA